ncbi:YqzE family protein [Paenibacillus radicis (ex Xue et al. 2023)]|uniref:YqzE family protein n=1 Tax=Paenibacillus radicis (ex Xue et al. 2023) TaxID=2972489 RepID=A0ABT1YG15_9BACL|nr:YqzE family protein [Paenibacillus radicis (ex Xue et al. 2023)]MCR8631168.1 YqzE family protein [Paenibacillus radicis (ex Xue et al. 2023)]
MAKSDELVKYVTEQLLHYMETPREVRKQVRANQREVREHWKYRWFGMLPVAIQMWTQSLRIKK